MMGRQWEKAELKRAVLQVISDDHVAQLNGLDSIWLICGEDDYYQTLDSTLLNEVKAEEADRFIRALARLGEDQLLMNCLFNVDCSTETWDILVEMITSGKGFDNVSTDFLIDIACHALDSNELTPAMKSQLFESFQYEEVFYLQWVRNQPLTVEQFKRIRGMGRGVLLSVIMSKKEYIVPQKFLEEIILNTDESIDLRVAAYRNQSMTPEKAVSLFKQLAEARTPKPVFYYFAEAIMTKKLSDEHINVLLDFVEKEPSIKISEFGMGGLYRNPFIALLNNLSISFETFLRIERFYAKAKQMNPDWAEDVHTPEIAKAIFNILCKFPETKDMPEEWLRELLTD